MSDHKHSYEYNAAKGEYLCIVCGWRVPEMAEPWTPTGENQEFHKDDESKLKQALFDLIQADARAERWGQQLSTLRERILLVVQKCEAKASQRESNINAAWVRDTLTGRLAKHIGSCREHGHKPIDCPNLQENNPLSRPLP